MLSVWPLTLSSSLPAAEGSSTSAAPRRVLVTGGSGFLGINLIRQLLPLGYRVVSYDVEPFAYPEADEIESVQADIRDRTALREAMKDVDVVVHAAAALPLYTPEQIWTTDVDGTENALALGQQAGVERFVMISSTAVYGVPDHHPLYETDPLVGVGPYGEAKIEAERRCLAYRDQGLCVTIVRPKSFVGPERLGVFALFYDWAEDGRNFPLLGSGRNRYQLLDVDDLCRAILLCITEPVEVVNDTFNIGAAEFTTMREDYQAVLDRAGHGKRIVTIPAAPAIALLKLLERLRLSPLYAWVYETAARDSYVSIDKAREQLGFRPRYSNKQALVRNYEWYLAHRHEFQGASGVTHRVPWKQGILALLKHLF
jgi:nucleoside-diphosphate-sugar epimerase